MKHILCLSLILMLISCTKAEKSSSNSFSFHLFHEPLNLDPARSRASSANYFFYNTLRGLYKIDENNKLVNEGGKCEWIDSKKLVCEIMDQFWSNGEKVTSKDYQKSFLRIIDPNIASPRAHLLMSLKNADKIISGLLPPDQLGFSIQSENKFILNFREEDREFIYKLSSTALYPLHKDSPYETSDYKKFLSNGPYQLETWESGKKITLTPNPYYKKGHPLRPKLNMHFVDDDKTAFRLYQKGVLNFLRRVPTQLFDQVKNSKDLIKVPMLRFDYIGFGKEILQNKIIRKTLTQSIDYKALKNILKSEGDIGCPSIPRNWYNQQKCHTKKIFTSPKEINEALKNLSAKNLNFKVSHLGGPDILKQAEFIQNQWKQNLNFKMNVQQVEQKIFLSELRTEPPAVFRKGVALDRPTCLSALETFAADSKQNFLNLDDKKYSKIINLMQKATTEDQYRDFCQQGINYLMDNFLIIPLGEMYFGMLADKQYQGWTINGMNQLDLAGLHKASKQNRL